MKLQTKIGSAIAAILAIALASCGTPVEPDQTVLEVKKTGDGAGFKNARVVEGGSWKDDWNTKNYFISNAIKTYVYTDALTEGRPIPEGLSFKTSDGHLIKLDLAITYTITDPKLFLSQIKAEDESVNSGYLYALAREKVNLIGARLTLANIVSLPGQPKQDTAATFADFHTQLLAALNAESKAYGITISKVSAVNGFKLPPTLADLLAATQQELITIQKNQAKANAESAQIDAQVKTAQSQLVLAKINAEITKVQAASLTQEFVLFTAVQKWNGVLPLGNTTSVGK